MSLSPEVLTSNDATKQITLYNLLTNQFIDIGTNESQKRILASVDGRYLFVAFFYSGTRYVRVINRDTLQPEYVLKLPTTFPQVSIGPYLVMRNFEDNIDNLILFNYRTRQYESVINVPLKSRLLNYIEGLYLFYDDGSLILYDGNVRKIINLVDNSKVEFRKGNIIFWGELYKLPPKLIFALDAIGFPKLEGSASLIGDTLFVTDWTESYMLSPDTKGDYHRTKLKPRRWDRNGLSAISIPVAGVGTPDGDLILAENDGKISSIRGSQFTLLHDLNWDPSYTSTIQLTANLVPIATIADVLSSYILRDLVMDLQGYL